MRSTIDWRACRRAAFDVVFLDPPYDDPSLDAGWSAAASVVAPDGLLVVEHARRRTIPARAGRLGRTRELRSGDSPLSFYRQAGARAAARRRRRTSHEPQHAGRFAIYPGSFDPLTNGHVDIIRRGARLFDCIVVGDPPEHREGAALLRRRADGDGAEVFADVPNVEVDSFEGLLVDYARLRRPA